jgi:ClpP class serine protease
MSPADAIEILQLDRPLTREERDKIEALIDDLCAELAEFCARRDAHRHRMGVAGSPIS